VSNCLFDDEFNITAVLDWTGCQTLPLESFALPPMRIIEPATDFLDYEWGRLLTKEARKLYHSRREMFLTILAEEEKARGYNCTPVTAMIRSPRSYFAHILDWEGITGFVNCWPEEEFFKWVMTLTELQSPFKVVHKKVETPGL
jgi:hypothetical protein